MTTRSLPLRPIGALLFSIFVLNARTAELLPPGFRPVPLGVHALVGGKLVTKPGETLDQGTIVIRDGLIKAVGKDVPVPDDARIWDMKGTVIYAGFIDPYLMLSGTNSPVTTSDTEPISSESFTAGGTKFFGVAGSDSRNPGPGYELTRITPEYRAIRDYVPKDKTLEPLREQGFTAGLVVPGKGIVRGTSVLVALAEDNPTELVLKPDVFQHISFETRGGEDRSYPGSLMGVIASVRQCVLDAQHYTGDSADYDKHPQERARPEFNLALDALGPALNKKMRVVFEPGSALMVDRAMRLATELGLDYCVVASGQEWRRPDLVKATGASFIVPLNFPELPKLPNEDDWNQVSLDQLRAWDWAAEDAALLRKQGVEIALTTYGLDDKKKFRQHLAQALERGLSETDALAALTTVPAKLCGIDNRLGTIEPGKLANLTVVTGKDYFDTSSKVREVWIDGRIYSMPPEEPKAPKSDEAKPKTPSAAQPDSKAKTESEKSETKSTEEKTSEDKKKKEQDRDLRKTRVAHSPLDGRGPLSEPKAVLIKNATLWTCGPEGTLEQADLLVANGKIQKIGKGLSADSDLANPAQVIDGAGLHVSPGLIDCHNHSVILGGVNEGTLPSSAMVRIHDVVNSETDNIRLQLAGGVTAVNLLHGSANPIGGQNCVIKLRDGASPEDLVFAAAPPGIKFALGENVKQSYLSSTSRFPQSRMGVRTFIANRFTAAQRYLAECDRCKTSGAVPPRRNLELEALGEIIRGERWIHCHSYRQDEILMLIDLMDNFHVKIGTFQHVLEGYKVADEIARHGAGASTFADWWAYKFEVYDAIPYNGTLMHDRGVVVSFNSDSSDLARRLYTEAAKAVKYGGASQIEALKFVTLNPARQLRIDKFVGSLEPGKDADFVVWSKAPLDASTICLQTWIEGKKYFDHDAEAQRAKTLAQERQDLLAKVKKMEKISGGGHEDHGPANTGESFFRVSLEHEFDGHDRGCLDD